MAAIIALVQPMYFTIHFGNLAFSFFYQDIADIFCVLLNVSCPCHVHSTIYMYYLICQYSVIY